MTIDRDTIRHHTPGMSTTVKQGASVPVWHAPLVPVALAATLGVIVDRVAEIPLLLSLFGACIALVAWWFARRATGSLLALGYLWLSIGFSAAAYHQSYIRIAESDALSALASEEPRLVQLQGVVEEEPVVSYPPADESLRSTTPTESTSMVIRAIRIKEQTAWRDTSGRARLVIHGRWEGAHVGDEIEAVGRMVKPHGAANPGEFSYAAALQDQRIGAVITVRKTPAAVSRRVEGWPASVFGWLAVLRGWGQRKLAETLPREESGIAMALILGDGSPMTTNDWARYMRTGVIHVLAISGQHLVVLAFFLWWIPRLAGVRRSRAAWFVGLFLLTYSLLVGGRPPVMRSAVMVCVACGGFMLRRPVSLANSFAFAWLVVGVLNPTDWFTAGCQLSFLSVAILYWGVARWFHSTPDPLQALIDQDRPSWQRAMLWLARTTGKVYAITAIVWLAVAPLVAGRFHLFSPIALLLGPPVSLLTSIALVAGFALLLASLVCWPLVPVFALATRWSLAACEWLVNLGDRLPGAHWYVPDVPTAWLVLLYLGLLSFLLVDRIQQYRRVAIVVGILWLGLGIVLTFRRPLDGELRCTFLSVGHGGCAVIETPDGRVLLYDAGTIGGPEVTRRQIAPFLWHRGIHRIDEVLLSHADLDHFNGLIELLERFTVSGVTVTPTFADKQTRGVRETLAALEHQGVPVRTVHDGDVLSAGEVTIEVLHPPLVVPPSPKENENSRSLVLRVQHHGHAFLLTGDLVGPGQDRVTQVPIPVVDVMMAPHHGGATANTMPLARWARPRLVVSAQEMPQDRQPATPELYRNLGATFLATWAHGAITARSREGSLLVETYVTRLRFSLEGPR